MADEGKLWFEMGVRDRVTENLTNIITLAAEVGKEMDAITRSERAVYENASKLEQIYDRIAIALRRIDDARSSTSDAGKLAKLNEMEAEVKKMLDHFKTLENNQEQLGVKGKVALEALKQGYALMLNQVSRYTNEVERAARAEEKKDEAEIRRTDKLKDKLYELQNLRKRISDAILNAPMGTDTSGASALAGQLWSKEMAVRRLMGSGGKIPLDFFGADYKELLRKVQDYTRTLEQDTAKAQRTAAQTARELARENQGLITTYDKVTQRAGMANKVLSQMQNQFASYASLYGAEHLLKNVIQVGGEFEVQHIALQSILGDLQQANSMFEQIKELAVVSPFNFRELVTYSKQIAAFGIPYEEMFDTTKRLADMSAGLGVDMQRLILAYGQVRSAAVLRGQELRQFTEAGIPMVQALAQEFTKLNGKVVTTGEVFELISKRAVPFEMVKKVLWDMTNEGGRFYNMQFTLADTLAGKWSNLQDAWEIMLSDFAKGESISGKVLKGLVTGLTYVIEKINTLTPLIAGVVSAFVTMKATKWIQGKGNLGFNGIDANIASAQRLRAIELTRAKINGEITAKQYAQRMQMNAQKSNYYQVLAMEGRLNAIQIQKLYQQGNLTKKQLAYLQVMKVITREQQKQILLGQLATGAFGRMKLAADGIKNSFKGIGKAGGIMMALDLAITLAIAYKGHLDEIKQKNKELSEGFSNRNNELKETLNGIEKAVPSSDEDYKSGIDGLKEILRQHYANYDAIILEANGIKTLKGQYEFLQKKLMEVKETYRKAETDAPTFGDAVRGFFEEANSRARDFAKSSSSRFDWNIDWRNLQILQEGDSFEDRMKRIAAEVRKMYSDIGKNPATNELYRQLRNSLEEQLGIGSQEKLLMNVRLNELLNITDEDTLADIITEKFGHAISEAEPQIANKLRYGMDLTPEERAKVQELMNDAVNETKKQYPYFQTTLQTLLDNSRFTATIELRYANAANMNGMQQQIYGNFPVVSSERIKTMAANWAKNSSMYEARNSAKRDIDALYNELQSRQDAYNKGKLKAADVDKTREEYEEAVSAALLGLGYDYKGEKKKSNKVKGGSKTDSSLKQLKAEYDLFKKFYSEYEKYVKLYGEAGALNKLKNDGEFKTVFGWGIDEKTLVDYEKAVSAIKKRLKGGANTADRSNFFASMTGDVSAENRKKEVDAISNINSELRTQLSIMNEQYETYKKIYQLTGNKSGAMNLAFGGGVQSDTFKGELMRRMQEELDKSGKTQKAEDVFAMDKNTFAKSFGENSQVFSELYNAYAANEKKIKQETLQLLEETVSKNRTLAQQIEDENRRYERQLQLIRQIKDPDLRQQAEQGATQEHQEKVAHLQFEQFKANSNWVKIFDDLDRVTTETLKDMMVATENFGKTAGLSVEDVKALQEAIAKMRNEMANRNPFYAMSDALSRMSILNKYEKQANKQGDLIANQELSSILGVKLGSIVSKKDIKNGKKAAGSDFVKGVEGLQGKFNALAGALDPVISLFDQLGMKEVGQTIGAVQGALGGAASGAAGAAALFGASAGPWGAAIGAGVSVLGSVASAIFGGHDEALEEEIKASKRRQKEMENLTKNLETVLEHTLGSLYVATADKEVTDKMTEYRQKYEERERARRELDNGNFTIMNMFNASRNGNIQDRTYDAIKEAEQSQSYYDAQKASLMIQQDELRSQIESEKDKKDTDWDKIQDMEQKIKELELEIRYFAEEMAKDLYGIDYKSWATGLAEALVGAWESGGDAVDAYKKKVTEMLKEVGTKMIAQKYLEPLLQKNMDEFIKYFESVDGRMDERGLEILAKMYDDADKAAAISSAFLDGMEQIANQHGETLKDTGSSSGTDAIKGITEEQASLLLSYINAMRADLSIHVQQFERFLTAVFPDGTNVFAQQLAQLKAIEANTRKSADNAAKIYQILDQMSTGVKKMATRVYTAS